MRDVRTHDVDGLLVLSPLRNDEVGKTLRGFDELLVHGLEHLEVAVDDHLGE